MLRSLPQLLLVAMLFLGQSVLGKTDSAFTNSLDVLKLSPDQARENHPVRLRGTVTCHVLESGLCFVQDQTAGIYVQPSPWPKDLEVGQFVEVTGVTAQGRFSPIVQMATLLPTGEKRSLTPRRISIDELNTGRFDCQFVELEGVVQKVELGANAVTLQLAVGGSAISAIIFSHMNPPTNSVDSRVRIQGTAGTLYDRDQLSGFSVFLQNSSFCRIVQPAPEPYSQPIRSSTNLFYYSPNGGLNHRSRLQGTVTFTWPGDSFFIRDDAGPIQIFPGNVASMPSPGDVVDVLGFSRRMVTNAPSLSHAAWKKISTSTVPNPQAIDLSQLASSTPRGQFVVTEGTVLSISSNKVGASLLLESDGQFVRAFSMKSLSKDLLHSTIRANGVFTMAPANASEHPERCLLIASNTVTMLKAPASQKPESTSMFPLAAAVSATLLLTAFLWTSRKSSRQALEQSTQVASKLQETEKELFQLKDARERLGRDLHDRIIQSIYAVGLSLEDCRHSLPDSARVKVRLKAALTEVNDVIRDLRNVISGLETNLIHPREFRTALKSLALTLGHERSNRIRLDLDQGALDALSPSQATELMHIAREAMSNSVRHGHSQTTTLSLQPHLDSLRFMVEDDGEGFDVEDTNPKGYGLRNMAKRAEDLGAEFTIYAKKDTGTRIVLDIPKQKQHFSQSEPSSRIDR